MYFLDNALNYNMESSAYIYICIYSFFNSGISFRFPKLFYGVCMSKKPTVFVLKT